MAAYIAPFQGNSQNLYHSNLFEALRIYFPRGIKTCMKMT